MIMILCHQTSTQGVHYGTEENLTLYLARQSYLSVQTHFFVGDLFIIIFFRGGGWGWGLRVRVVLFLTERKLCLMQVSVQRVRITSRQIALCPTRIGLHSSPLWCPGCWRIPRWTGSEWDPRPWKISSSARAASRLVSANRQAAALAATARFPDQIWTQTKSHTLKSSSNNLWTQGNLWKHNALENKSQRHKDGERKVDFNLIMTDWHSV
jgi:hypothetical protein